MKVESPLNLLRTTNFGVNSRYYGVPLGTLTLPDGTTIAYVRRRFIPPPESYVLLSQHIVQDGERLDNLAAQTLGDPEAAWRLCDANNVLNPAELEQPGRVVHITLPQGIQG
jgi:hypothetical protein